MGSQLGVERQAVSADNMAAMRGGHLYPRFSPCSEWDTAAGHALLEAAGGALLGLDGQPLTYNRSESLLSPYFLAVADREHPLWRELLEELRTG